MAAPQPAMNRGEFLRTIGTTGQRNDDGSYDLLNPCSLCGAHRMSVTWEKQAGLAGTVHHQGDNPGEGCELSTDEELARWKKPEPMPVTDSTCTTPLKLHVATEPSGHAPPCDAAIDFVQFANDVSVPTYVDPSAKLSFWTRKKHAEKCGVMIEKGYLILRFRTGGRRRRVPMTNVDFIDEEDSDE
jgi:hypothetical protein